MTSALSFFDKVEALALSRQSRICVGLDPVLSRLPEPFAVDADSLLPFGKAIIDVTSDLVCAYKLQIAFYAASGAERALEKTIRYIHDNTSVPVILDAKRGDIASTAAAYATEAFERYAADAVTVNPYLGGDALVPFTRYADRGVFVLCRTSNPAGSELQHHGHESGLPVYEKVAELARDQWNSRGNLGLVVGATRPEELARVRNIVPELPLLVPGVGAQGGDLQASLKANQDGPMLINSSRSIIYASSGRDFAERARAATESLRQLTVTPRP